MFKRYVYFQLRIMSHVPGLKTYSRFVKRCFDRNFWGTYGVLFALNLASMAAYMELFKRYSVKTQPVPKVDVPKIMRDIAREQENIAARSGYDFSTPRSKAETAAHYADLVEQAKASNEGHGLRDQYR